MRPILAMALVAIFVALLTIDPLVCADGCRDEGDIAPAARTTCAICLGLGPVVGHFAVGPLESSFPSAAAARLWPDQLVVPPIDHPPQPA